jgi:hypothetical protein
MNKIFDAAVIDDILIVDGKVDAAVVPLTFNPLARILALIVGLMIDA